MILRRLVFAALRTAASNPEVRRQAAKLAERGLQSAKPGLLTASRKAGQAVRAPQMNCLTGSANSKRAVRAQMMRLFPQLMKRRRVRAQKRKRCAISRRAKADPALSYCRLRAILVF